MTDIGGISEPWVSICRVESEISRVSAARFIALASSLRFGSRRHASLGIAESSFACLKTGMDRLNEFRDMTLPEYLASYYHTWFI